MAGTDPSVYLKCALANSGYISVSTPAAPLTDTVAEQKLIATVAQSTFFLCLTFQSIICRLSKLHRYTRLCSTDTVVDKNGRSCIRYRSIVFY
jgi:hypothetical protein